MKTKKAESKMRIQIYAGEKGRREKGGRKGRKERKELGREGGKEGGIKEGWKKGRMGGLKQRKRSAKRRSESRLARICGKKRATKEHKPLPHHRSR